MHWRYSKPAKFPMEQNLVLIQSDGDHLNDPSSYRCLVGRSIFLSITRPDLVYAVNFLSQLMDKSRISHFEVAYRVFKNLKHTPRHCILLSSTSTLQLKEFVDADQAWCKDTKRSTIGHCIFLGQSPISQKTKKQTIRARSTAVAEYHFMAVTCWEVTWLKNILIDLEIKHT